MKRLFLAGLLALLSSGAFAQTCPTFVTGMVPTAAQWNACFAAKQNALGYTPVNKAGDVMAGILVTFPSSVLLSGFRVPHGSAPTSPTNGDLWTTTSGMFVRINGATVGPLAGPSGGAFAATSPLAVTFPSSVVTYAITGQAGGILAGAGPAFTRTPTLGVAGSVLGTLTFENVTSGTLTIRPATGALGTSVWTFPAVTDTVIGAATTTTFTNKTYDTAATGNSFSINGLAATANTGTGAVVRDTSPTIASPTFSGTVAGADTIPLTILKTIATNTVLGNATSGTAAVTAMSVTGCSSASSALIWTTNTGFGCNTAITASAVPASGLTGTTLASNVVTSSLTTVGALGAGSATTGFTINGASVTWGSQIAGANVVAAGNASSGTPSATFGVVKCDGVTINCTSGVISGVGASATDIAVGTTTVTSGTSAYLLYNNAGVLGNRTIASVLTAGTGIGVSGTTNATITNSGLVTIVRQVITATATYTPTAGMKYVDAVCTAIGGTGGAGAAVSGGGGGGGGGAGSTQFGSFSAATIGASQSVTIGSAGADTTLGSLLVAKSGAVGEAGSGGNGGRGGTGGSGGTSQSGAPSIIGGDGGGASIGIAASINGGAGSGGSSYWGGGGAGGGGSGNGVAGRAYGSGGGGGGGNSGTGAAGATGVCAFTEYVGG